MSASPRHFQDRSDAAACPRDAGEGALLEADIVRLVQAGDLQAYESLLLGRGHAKRLRAWLAARSPRAELAEEVAQEAFIVAYQQIRRFRAGTDFGAWLRAVAFQLLRQARKRFAVRQRHCAVWLAEAAVTDNVPSPQLDTLIEHLERCLEPVPSHIRTLLTQRYHDELSVSEMGKAAGQTPEWVRTTLYRVRQQLRECIEQRQRTPGHHQPSIPK